MLHFPRFSAIALLALIWLACCPPARPAPYDMVEHAVASAPGTGTITFGSAIPPYRSLSATGAVTGETIPYAIRDGLNWENGRGIVNFGTNITLTRGPLSSSIGGGAITATSNAIVYVGALAEDMVTTQYPSAVVTRISETPCVVSGTSGTLTLDLSTCSGTGSSDNFHIGPLTGATTVVFTNPIPGQRVTLEIAANTQSVILPACIGPTPVAVSGNSFIVYDVFDATPTYWCPAGVQAGLTAPAAFVQAKFGAKATSGTTFSVTMTSAMTAGHTMACLAIYNTSAGTVTVSDGTTSYTVLDGPSTLGSGSVETFYLLSVVGSPTTVTATSTSSLTLGGLECMEASKPPGSGAILIDAHGLNPQTAASSAADAVTSGNVTTTNPTELLLGLSINTQPVTVNAGTGETLAQQDTSNTAYGASMEYKLTGAAGTYAGTFTSTSGSSVNYGSAAIVLH